MGTKQVNTAPEVEREVVAAMLNDDVACATGVELLSREHFSDGKLAKTFEAMRTLFAAGTPVDLVTVSQVDGIDPYFVTEIAAGHVSARNTAHHALILVEKWMLRETERVMRHRTQEIQRGDADAFDVLESVQQDLASIAVGRYRETHIREAVREARERLGEWQGGESTDYFPTGIYSLDRKINGYPIGELTTLAAQSGSGKTSWIIQSIVASARRIKQSRRDPQAVLLFSCEMTREQIASRAASNLSGASLDVIRSSPSPYALAEYEKALELIEALTIHVDDTPNPTLEYIAARCQQVKVRDGLGLVGIDYHEKVLAEGQTEELRVSATAQGLKAIAKRFQVALLDLVQYSRSGEANSGAPLDSWIRYSGKVAQESAVILHWYWPGYFAKKGQHVENYDPHRHGAGTLIITKNRFGRTGKVPLEFDEASTRFIDPADPDNLTPSRRRAYVPQGDQYEFAPTDDKPF